MSAKATIATRKPITELKPADLRAFVVWEFASDEESDDPNRDETWVRPVEATSVRRGEYSQIVACDLKTVQGLHLDGFMIVSTARKRIEITPGAIVGSDFYAVLPSLSRCEAEMKTYTWVLVDRDRLSKRLAASEDEVFPISFQLRTAIGREKTQRSGVVE